MHQFSESQTKVPWSAIILKIVIFIRICMVNRQGLPLQLICHTTSYTNGNFQDHGAWSMTLRIGPLTSSFQWYLWGQALQELSYPWWRCINSSFVCLLNRLATNVDVPCCSNRVVERFSFCGQFSQSTLPHVFYCPFGGFSFDSSVARPHGHLESIHVQGFISGEIL